MKAFVVYDNVTGKIWGTRSTTSNVLPPPDHPAGMSRVEIPIDHIVLHDQENWEVKSRKLMRRNV